MKIDKIITLVVSILQTIKEDLPPTTPPYVGALLSLAISILQHVSPELWHPAIVGHEFAVPEIATTLPPQQDWTPDRLRKWAEDRVAPARPE